MNQLKLAPPHSPSLFEHRLDDRPGFHVEDTGPGIQAKKRANVFETGYTTDTEGTGFRLTIVEGSPRHTGGELTPWTERKVVLGSIPRSGGGSLPSSSMCTRKNQ